MEQISREEMERIIAQAVAKVKNQGEINQPNPEKMPEKKKTDAELRKEDALDLAELVYAAFDRRVANDSMEQKG